MGRHKNEEKGANGGEQCASSLVLMIALITWHTRLRQQFVACDIWQHLKKRQSVAEQFAIIRIANRQLEKCQ